MNSIKKAMSFLQRSHAQRALAFLAGFFLLFIYLLLRNEQENPYDAWTYTQMSQSFIQNGLFNFDAFATDYGEGFRGYLFPWILAACHDAATIVPWLDYRFAVSAFASLICAVLMPDLICRCLSIRWNTATCRFTRTASRFTRSASATSRSRRGR